MNLSVWLVDEDGCCGTGRSDTGENYDLSSVGMIV